MHGEDSGVPTVEIAHEALIRKWARLRQWLHEDRDKLVELNEVEGWTQQWLNFGTFLDGNQLGYAVRVRDKYPDDLDSTASDMITASQRNEAIQRRRSRRRLNIALAVSLAVAMVMAALGSWASQEAKRAIREQSNAEQQRQVAELERERAEEQEKKANRAAAKARDAASRAQRAAERERWARANAELAEKQEKLARQAAEKARAEAQRRAYLEAEARAEAVRARDAEADARVAEVRARRRAEALADEEKRRADELQRKLDGSLLPELPQPATAEAAN